MSWNSGSFHWDIAFTIVVDDWELKDLSSFLDVIYSFKERS
jgi:hypothetical protein